MILNNLNLNSKILVKKHLSEVEKDLKLKKEQPILTEKQEPTKIERQNQDSASTKMLEDYIQNCEEYINSTLFSEEEIDEIPPKSFINPNINSPDEFPNDSYTIIQYLKGELPLEDYFGVMQTPDFKYEGSAKGGGTERAIKLILEASEINENDSLDEKINKVLVFYDKLGAERKGDSAAGDWIKEDYKNDRMADRNTIYTFMLNNGFIHEIVYSYDEVKSELENYLKFWHYNESGNVVVEYDYTEYADKIIDEYNEKYYDKVEKDGKTVYLSKDNPKTRRQPSVQTNGNELYLGTDPYFDEKKIVLGTIENDEVKTEAEKIRDQIINSGTISLNVDSHFNTQNLLSEPSENDFNEYRVEEKIHLGDGVYTFKYYREPLNINGTYKNGLYSDGNRTFMWTGQNFIEIPNDLFDEKGRITEKYADSEYSYKEINGIAGYEEYLAVIRGGYSLIELSSQCVSGHFLYTKDGNVYYYDKQSHSMRIVPDLKAE